MDGVVIYYKNFNPSKINLYISRRFVRVLEKIVWCSIKEYDSGDNRAVEKCIVPARVVIFGSHIWLKLFICDL